MTNKRKVGNNLTIILIIITSFLMGILAKGYFNRTREEPNNINRNDLQVNINSNNGQEGEKINLNTATLEELKSLPGIGDIKAKEIIENRPYTNTYELLDKKIVGEEVFNQIKEKVVVK